MKFLETTLYFEDHGKLYIVDDISLYADEENISLPLVETFGLVRSYEEPDQTRKLNTFYVWYKEAQEVFKCEITINGSIGWEGSNFVFIGIGSTEHNCLADAIAQFSTHNTIENVDPS